MHQIYKYPLDIMSDQSIELPESAQILSVKAQRDRLVLYALVDSSKVNVSRHIEIFGTGHPIFLCASQKYIGSVVMPTQDLVWHVFERLEGRN